MESSTGESSDSVSIMSVSSSSNEGIDKEPNISYLPWEVLQEIFRKLDGKSLLICKRVCKSWRNHVHHLEQKLNFWYKNCQNEIPSWTQFDLLDNMFPSHWKDQRSVDWQEIYKCWYMWNSIYEAPTTYSCKLVGLFNGISSIKVSGEWLLISTCEGRGKLSAHRLSGTGDTVDLYVGGGAIVDFELVISDKIPCSNVKPPTVLKEIFDTIVHNEIWLELKDSYIQLGKTYCHTLDKIQQKVSHSYGYEVRLVSDHHSSSLVLKKTCSKIFGPELMELELSSTYAQILDFWMNKISLGTLDCYKHMIIDAVSINHKTQQASLTDSIDYNLAGESCDIYSWHGSLFVLYTNRRRIRIHQDGMQKSQVIPVKKGCVTSVLFYANHFFLGTERGKLLIYKVESPKDCLEVTVYETPSWEIDVCLVKITHIAIAEPLHHKRRGPEIICATPEDIYKVSLSW